MAKKVVLAGACRTAIGSMGGSLSTTPAAELGAVVIKEALNRAGVAPEQVDHVYMGCVIQAGLYKCMYSEYQCHYEHCQNRISEPVLGRRI